MKSEFLWHFFLYCLDFQERFLETDPLIVNAFSAALGSGNSS
jgi:hypothetical protein